MNVSDWNLNKLKLFFISCTKFFPFKILFKNYTNLSKINKSNKAFLSYVALSISFYIKATKSALYVESEGSDLLKSAILYFL